MKYITLSLVLLNVSAFADIPTIPNGWCGQPFCPSPIVTAPPIVQPVQPVTPLIPAPVAPVRKKFYYCPSTQQFYPTVKTCDVDWKIVYAD